MSGAAQTAAASSAVVLEMDSLDVLERAQGSDRDSHGSANPETSSPRATSPNGPAPKHGSNTTAAHVDIPKLVVGEGQLNIREFYDSVKAPGTKTNLKFVAEVS